MAKSTRPIVRSAFDHPTVILSTELPSKTKQSFSDECDINRIMGRWAKTGDFGHVNMARPTYGDFTNPASYLEAINLVDQADALFAELPSEVRDRMSNDPAELLRFVADPANQAEAIELGIASDPGPDPKAQPPEAPKETLSPPKPTPVAGGE